MLQVHVGRNKNRKPFLLGRVEQLAVLQSGPALFVSSRDVVLRQELPQRDRSTLVKQYAHLGRGQSATCRVFQHRADLFQGDARKPLNEL